jgi:hypothetical protein
MIAVRQAHRRSSLNATVHTVCGSAPMLQEAAGLGPVPRDTVGREPAALAYGEDQHVALPPIWNHQPPLLQA